MVEAKATVPIKLFNSMVLHNRTVGSVTPNIKIWNVFYFWAVVRCYGTYVFIPLKSGKPKKNLV